MAGILASGDEREATAGREREMRQEDSETVGECYTTEFGQSTGQSKGMVGGKDKIVGFRHIVLCFGL